MIYGWIQTHDSALWKPALRDTPTIRLEKCNCVIHLLSSKIGKHKMNCVIHLLSSKIGKHKMNHQ